MIMKRILTTLFILCMCVIHMYTNEHVVYSASETTVYICVTGKVYHSTKNCRGLSNATHKIEAVSLSEAKKTRRACKICY